MKLYTEMVRLSVSVEIDATYVLIGITKQPHTRHNYLHCQAPAS